MTLAILCGGHSSERLISFKSTRSIVEALEGTFAPLLIDTGRSELFTDFDLQQEKEPLPLSTVLTADLLSLIKKHHVSKTCIMLHGGVGEDGHIQGLLDLCGIPYTGSGMGASFMGMHKALSKYIMAYHHIPTPDWVTLKAERPFPPSPPLPLPLIVKPVREGSTKGLTKVEKEKQWKEALKTAFASDEEVLVESFIPGRELTLPVDESGCHLPVEIIPKKGLYDYESKYSKGKSRYICPADIPEGLFQGMSRDALFLYEKMSLRGIVRFDIRLNGDQYFFLEVNTLPGMTALSLVPMSFQAEGVSYKELIQRIFHG